MQDNKTPLGYITQTVLPSATVAEALVYGGPTIVNGIRTTVSSPSTILPAAKTLVKEGVKGTVGATVADAASKATTGKTLGEQVAQSTGVSPDFGEFIIPGAAVYSQVHNIVRRPIQAGITIDLLTPLSVNKFSKVIQTAPKTVGQKYVAPYISSKILNRNNPTIEAVNDLFNINFINRNTAFGKNSGKAIHADYGDNTSGFVKGTTGASIINGKLLPGHNPNTEVDYIWWNVDKPYATGINDRAFTRYIIKSEKSIPGIINIREQSRPIGQWNGKSGFVTKSERVTPEPVPLDDATIIEYNPITRVYENKLIVPGNRSLK